MLTKPSVPPDDVRTPPPSPPPPSSPPPSPPPSSPPSPPSPPPPSSPSPPAPLAASAIGAFDSDTAARLDESDPLRPFRAHFSLPDGIYLCGQSLGACPNDAADAVAHHVQRWRTLGVHAHFHPDDGWAAIDALPAQLLMPIVGARYAHEVAVMNSLTVNLHAMLTAFYRPQPRRYKVLMEQHAFPSDVYAVRSHLSARGVSAHDAVLFVHPRPAEHLIRDDDLLRLIDRHAHSLALILLPGVQYCTGQLLPMRRIAQRARRHAIACGLDLAHAVGNVELSLHDWQVDFAVWCSYKYLNAGPGAVAGLFVHHRHADAALPRHAGWWGHAEHTRFHMPPVFDPQRGARGFQQSNPPVLALAPLTASLRLFHRAGGMRALRAKSVLLSEFLRRGLLAVVGDAVRIISPPDSARRGCQISFALARGAAARTHAVARLLRERGVACDLRRPHVLRVAPVPLYNSFADVYAFVRVLQQVLHTV